MNIIKTTSFARHSMMLFASLLALASFWIFSRFTVDDAFITWRYGKNLVHSGIWNYNPSTFDLTQAYTNPALALLGIIPAYLSIDTVFFFKCFSILTLGTFIGWFIRKCKSLICHFVLVLFLALPACMTHIFSGLETFIFVALTTALLFYLSEDKLEPALFLTILLFLIRPESWLLLGLVPAFFLTKPLNIDIKNITRPRAPSHLDLTSFAKSALVLGIPLIVYFAFHKWHFNEFLPNTFYVKSGKTLSLSLFFQLLILASPLLLFVLIEKIRLFILSALFFGAMIISYSTANLQMNYSGRFAFHVYAPVFLTCLLMLSKMEIFPKKYRIRDIIRTSPNNYSKLIISSTLILSVVVFIKISSTFGDLAYSTTYYQRALDSHARLGKAIKLISHEHQIKSIAFGDAGMTAFHAELLALDNIGLGSHLVATEGITPNVIDKYNPDIIMFHTNHEGIITNLYGQDVILQWAISQNMQYVCDVYWRHDYLVRIYSHHPYQLLIDTCKISKTKNINGDMSYLLADLTIPPWNYWTE